MADLSNTETSSSINRDLSVRTRRQRKPKKNLIPVGIGVLVVIVIIGLLLAMKSALLGFFWLTGIGFGFILQKARFCFTASLRDPYLTGGTSLTKAVLIAFVVTTIGFTAIKYGAFIRGLPIPGQGYVVPISFATIFGAFIFGIGMVISGGCASGTLMRVGEGFYMQMLSLAFFIIGSLWGAHDFGWWKLHFMIEGKAVFLPDVFGWFFALVIQLLFIGLLYILADRWEQRGQKQG